MQSEKKLPSKLKIANSVLSGVSGMSENVLSQAV